jgi:hypothetical protein
VLRQTEVVARTRHQLAEDLATSIADVLKTMAMKKEEARKKVNRVHGCVCMALWSPSEITLVDLPSMSDFIKSSSPIVTKRTPKKIKQNKRTMMLVLK